MSTLKVSNIQDISNNAAMSISGGIVTQINNPLFLARGADNVAMANNTWVKVTFNSEVYDVGGYYDPTTNYRYTPLVAGKYLIYGRVYITYGSDAIDGVRIAIYKNGSNVAEFNRYSVAATSDVFGSVQVQSIIDMNGSSDYLEIYARHNVSADGVYYASGAYGEFSGYRIGG